MKISARSAVRTVHDAVRTKLWPLPILGVTIAAVLGVLIPHLDARVDAQLPGWLDSVVFSGDAGAARTVLDAVASSLITVTSLTFSLTVVTLQLASSQFSPRLLRTFTQDIFVQVTLAVFLSTSTFSLTVLRSVRSPDASVSPFVPRLAVTTSFLLAIASVACLVLFLAHLTRQIRVETMLRNVHHDASETISANLEARKGTPPATDEIVSLPADAETVWAWESGFLLRVDQDELRRAAEKTGITVRIQRHPGDFVVDGTPLGATWSRRGGRCPANIEQSSTRRYAPRSIWVRSEHRPRRRVRAAPAHRRHQQGPVTGDQRPDHSHPRHRPRRSPVGRAGGLPPWPARPVRRRAGGPGGHRPA